MVKETDDRTMVFILFEEALTRSGGWRRRASSLARKEFQKSWNEVLDENNVRLEIHKKKVPE